MAEKIKCPCGRTVRIVFWNNNQSFPTYAAHYVDAGGVRALCNYAGAPIPKEKIK